MTDQSPRNHGPHQSTTRRQGAGTAEGRARGLHSTRVSKLIRRPGIDPGPGVSGHRPDTGKQTHRGMGRGRIAPVDVEILVAAITLQQTGHSSFLPLCPEKAPRGAASAGFAVSMVSPNQSPPFTARPAVAGCSKGLQALPSAGFPRAKTYRLRSETPFWGQLRTRDLRPVFRKFLWRNGRGGEI
jgi:hypothetical protein